MFLLKIPPHLICVATLPCETLPSENERQSQTNALINENYQECRRLKQSVLLVGSRIKSAREPVFCRNGWTDRAAAFDLSQSVFSGIFLSGISEICYCPHRAASLWNFVHDSGLRTKCRHGRSIVATCCQLIRDTHTYTHTHLAALCPGLPG